MTPILTAIVALIILALLLNARLRTVSRNRVNDGVNAIADALASPVNDSKAELDKARGTANELQSMVAELNSSSTELNQKAYDAKQDVDKFERLAKQAGQAGNVEDVKQALNLKSNAQNTLDNLTKQITNNNSLREKLETQLGELVSDIDEAERSQTVDSIRLKNAKIREKNAQRAAKLLNGGAEFAGASALKQAADRAEANASGWEQTVQGSPLGKTQALEQKYASSAVSDDEIAKYLAKS